VRLGLSLLLSQPSGYGHRINKYLASDPDETRIEAIVLGITNEPSQISLWKCWSLFRKLSNCP
jgi:hypothetical protein